jgi:hypothetical protein
MTFLPQWTLKRVATDLAIILVAVPVALDWLVPKPRGGCGMTPEFFAESLGLAILGVRTTWLALKWLNDPGERWLERILTRKPQPLDDL